MKWGIVVALLVLAISGCATTPADLHTVDTQQLCVDYAQTVITGMPIARPGFKQANGAQLQTELAERGEKCLPPERYLQLAYARIQLQQQQQQALIQSLSAAAQIEQAAQPRPAYTQPTMHWMNSTCGWNGNQWQCNSLGN